MAYLSAAHAARYLAVSERTVRNMIGRGELETLSTDPVRLDPAHVADVLAVRQQQVALELTLQRTDAVALARQTRAMLRRERGGVNLPEDLAAYQQRRLALAPMAAKTTFGLAALSAAQTDDGCRWCKAAAFGRLPGMWAPTVFSEGFRELFGQDPCQVCGPSLCARAMDALRARVHAGGGGLLEARAQAPAPRMRAEPRPAAKQAPTPARPVQDDGGKGMVQRRLKETRARLKTAERSGDRQYATQLRRTLATLTADAARVDGRDAAPRGRKACGTPVGTRCECHTSDRRRQQ